MKDGILVQDWDDKTRRYTEFDDTGVTVSQRPYTVTENSTADVALAASSDTLNRNKLRAGVEAQIVILLAKVTDINGLISTPDETIAGNPVPYIKGLARVQKVLCQDIIALARIVTDAVDSVDVGK